MNKVLVKSFLFSGDGMTVFEALKEEPYLFFLDSSLTHESHGRYSFLGFDPFFVHETKAKDSLGRLRDEFRHFGGNITSPATPFPAGLVGFLSYDYGLQIEKIERRSTDDLHLPDCCFGFYDCVITIDHYAKKMHITSSGLPETTASLCQRRAQERLDIIERKICHVLDEKKQIRFFSEYGQGPAPAELLCNFTETQYIRAAEKALNYIAQGEIYQVNLSQRFEWPNLKDNLDLRRMYGLLRELSPSSFSAFFDGGRFQLLSSSPEQFLRLRQKRVSTRPMKGTRPRGKTDKEDLRMYEELSTSEKEKAELLMITDLLRNDLGRACEYGSVEVKSMREIESYKTVFQATSLIEGRLREDVDAFDLLQKCYPGGSITGCPKIRAMQIIEELEPTRRSIYTGAMGYISCSGDMDFNILIRTLLAKENRLYFQSGSGIVADSDPRMEYEETLIKAQAIKACLEKAVLGGRASCSL